MRALQYAGPGRAEVVELPVPAIADDEVLVAARSVGVCHSDIELLEGRYIIPFSYPQIPGHEWSGQIARVGRGVTGLAPGDRVVGECVIGADHFGFSLSGAAAEFFVAKPSWLHRLPDELSWTMGALVAPLSVAYYGLVRAGGTAPARLGLIQSKELRVTGSIGSPGVWPQTLRFLARSTVDLTPLVTHRFGVDRALDALAAARQPASTIKAHVELDASV